ncbi:MAG: DUF4867 family protein [Bacillota bacterium]|nr:DUF4867 family protein [Bacillota bacterium]
MTIERIQKLNPQIPIHSLYDYQKKYGYVLDYELVDLVEYVNKNLYVRGSKFDCHYDISELHEFKIVKTIQKEIFANAPIRFGTITGFNENVYALYKTLKNEVYVAFTDCLFIVEKEGQFIGLYLHKGQILEFLAGTVHSLPVMVTLNGYCVGLLTLDNKKAKESFEMLRVVNDGSFLHQNFLESVIQLEEKIHIRCVNR